MESQNSSLFDQVLGLCSVLEMRKAVYDFWVENPEVTLIGFDINDTPCCSSKECTFVIESMFFVGQEEKESFLRRYGEEGLPDRFVHILTDVVLGNEYGIRRPGLRDAFSLSYDPLPCLVARPEILIEPLKDFRQSLFSGIISPIH